MRTIHICFISILLAGAAVAQDFRAEIDSTFNFVPHKMKKDEQARVIPKLDAFFDKVMKNKGKYLDSLRIELRSDGHYPYFYYDGGILLTEISSAPEDCQLAADALEKADYNDIPTDIYVKVLLSLSKKGANVINPLLVILKDTSFSPYFPKHVLELKHVDCLKLILLRYGPGLYIEKLVSYYDKAISNDIKKAIIEIMFYSCDCKADEFIRKVHTSKDESAQIRDFAKVFLDIDGKWEVNKARYDELSKKKSGILTNISDEALLELEELVKEMKFSYKCE